MEDVAVLATLPTGASPLPPARAPALASPALPAAPAAPVTPAGAPASGFAKAPAASDGSAATFAAAPPASDVPAADSAAVHPALPTAAGKPARDAAAKPADPAFDPGAVDGSAASAWSAPAAAAQPALRASPLAAAAGSPASPVLENVPAERVAVEIASAVRHGVREIAVRLDPPELGRVEVSMDVDDSGRVTAHILVERGDTLDRLRRDAPNLQQSLRDAGFSTDGGSLQFSLRDSRPDTGQSGRDRRRPQRGAVAEGAAAPAQRWTGTNIIAGLRGGIDVRL